LNGNCQPLYQYLKYSIHPTNSRAVSQIIATYDMLKIKKPLQAFYFCIEFD